MERVPQAYPLFNIRSKAKDSRRISLKRHSEQVANYILFDFGQKKLSKCRVFRFKSNKNILYENSRKSSILMAAARTKVDFYTSFRIKSFSHCGHNFFLIHVIKCLSFASAYSLHTHEKNNLPENIMPKKGRKYKIMVNSNLCLKRVTKLMSSRNR